MNSSQRFLRTLFATLTGMAVSLALPIAGSVVVMRCLPDLRVLNLALHSLLETIGGMMALAISGILIAHEARRSENAHFVWMASALGATGVLELFHAAVSPDNHFVWLHSLATMVGGVLFAGVWLPAHRLVSSWRLRLPAVFILTAIVLGLVSCLRPEWLPKMIEADRFAVGARGLHIVGGLGFAVASVFFVLRFHRYGHLDDWLFAVTTQLFAAAALLFELSALWDLAWWWWHALRLLAYLATLVFGLIAFLRMDSELMRLNRQLTETNRDLDQIVAERTADLLASQERFALAVRGSTDGLWDWNVLTDEVYYSPRFKELLGYADHEMENVFSAFESRLHPDDVKPTMNALQTHLREDIPYNVEYRLRVKTGDYRWYWARGQAIWDDRGRPKRMAGSITDITERKRSEKKLRNRDAQMLAAQRIQQQLLPGSAPEAKGLDIAGASFPAEFAGGDFFDFPACPDGCLNTVLGDVSGHGLGAALAMAGTQSLLQVLSQSHSDFTSLFNRANAFLTAPSASGRLVTIIATRIEAGNRSLVYLNAGHPAAYVLDAAGNVRELLESSALPLGVDASLQYPQATTVPLKPDDLVLLLTDGVIEAKSSEQVQFGSERALDLVRENRNCSAKEIIHKLHRSVVDFAEGTAPNDDITAVIIKVSAAR
jgi:PAS domain S-box-containing protein